MNPVDFSIFKGKVVLIVNVASECGYTKTNYEMLNEMYDRYYHTTEFEIVAFPCNQFGRQEPGTNQEIKEFATKHGVKFQLMNKIDVNGPDAPELWRWLRSNGGKQDNNDIEWNFAKFLISKNGEVVRRYKSPAHDIIAKEIEAELRKPREEDD
eukprot:TRINITY_DN1642_c0_g1_i2.p1 TRINITY_DN1642_c0_g1~~TRINITY_DN1642_c0_g1_i2.p1  ORF type:complete len:154 (-),score=25.62 TRINITY_DN1642_c0_g1_i2:68-529(-)